MRGYNCVRFAGRKSDYNNTCSLVNIITQPIQSAIQTQTMQLGLDANLSLRGRIQEAIERLIIERPEQLITQIRTRATQKSLEIFKSSIKVQPIWRLIIEAESSRYWCSIRTLAARRMLSWCKSRHWVEQVWHWRRLLLL